MRVSLGLAPSLDHRVADAFPLPIASPHVIGSVLDAIEAMRVALGPGIVLNYVLQGLWHPARRVREVFWSIYSSLYMGAQDALVPYYPTSESTVPREVEL